MPIVTRFPPSPTGDLHIGSARTALYNWLYARGQGGSLVLRLEDTDRERSTQQAVDVILEGLLWLGLDYDAGPFYQTQRFDRYREVVAQLQGAGKAYPCYCSRERLDELRATQQAAKEKPRYDGHCRDNAAADNGNPPVMRFRTPLEGEVTIADRVRGMVTIANNELDDLIIARSDGTPTYHLTVVVDDIDMNVSHVIRGDDHLNNTPRQIHILDALGAERPIYAHMPMINGSDGKRLSKRHGAVSVLQYRDDGILPQALLNYLARLGWSHGDQEIFSMAEMQQMFDIDDINKSAAAFDQEKLLWVNQHYIQQLELEELMQHAAPHFVAAGIDISDKFGPFNGFDQDAAKKHLRPVAAEPLKLLHERLAEIETWEAEALQKTVEAVAETLELKLGKVAQPLRVAVTGASASPSIDVTLMLVGREQCLQRLSLAADFISARAAET